MLLEQPFVFRRFHARTVLQGPLSWRLQDRGVKITSLRG
jgi:hypothetical protein